MMIFTSISTLIRFLIGVVLLQGATGLIIYIALRTDWLVTWPLFLALGLMVGAMAALWFSTIAGASRHHVVARAAERFSKEREQIRVKAEQQRLKEVRSSVKAMRKAGAGMSLKSALVVGGAAGLGLTMMLTQFITLGIFTVAAAGGAALGYGVRVRQEKIIARRELAADERALNLITVADPLPALPTRKRKGKPGEGA